MKTERQLADHLIENGHVIVDQLDEALAGGTIGRSPDYEPSKSRLAEIRQAEAEAKREEKRPESGRKGRPPPGRVRSRH